jgi:hypothetical protein
MDSSQTPRQLFEDTLRPAELLLRVYRLLEHDEVQSEGEMITALRGLVRAHDDEDLMLIANEIFVGLVRERAQMPRKALRRSALCSLLRQAVVVSCTAMETYLPALLQTHLPTVIAARGRDFLPNNKELRGFFANLTFGLDETLRIVNTDEAPLYIANKLIRFTSYQYLSGAKGVQTVGLLLSLDDPWAQVAVRLDRDGAQLQKIVKDTAERRNDIVHRADRAATDTTGEAQEMGFAWARQAVDSINHVCLALDELVGQRMATLESDRAIVGDSSVA